MLSERMTQSESEYHKNLASIIKGTHAKLRLDYRNCKDESEYEKVWREHCQDEAALKRYRDAMFHLANDVWVKRGSTRIDWIKDTCVQYFHTGLKKVLEKEKRRAEFKKLKTSVLNDTTDTSQLRDDSSIDVHDTFLESPSNDAHNILIPHKGRISLLDVGSCYNAFQEFPEFLSVGIDISPAVPNVFRCDFLNLVIDKKEPATNDLCETMEKHTVRMTDPNVTNSVSHDFLQNFELRDCDFNTAKESSFREIESLPANSFHVVLFSLLLEYLPCTSQRWRCVEKAHRLLAHNGLLVIVTPDSHHQNKHVPMMKSWRRAIQALGFQRYCYEKQEHLHCMAYRKVAREAATDPDVGAHMLYIPQDLSDTCVRTGEASKTRDQESDEEPPDRALVFRDLPLFDLD